MAAQDELQLTITLQDGSVVNGLLNIAKEAKSAGQKVEKEIGGAFDGISGSVKAIGLSLAAAFTVTKIVSFFQTATAAAAEAERATNALSASLSQIGKFSAGAVSSFSDFTTALQGTTGISDDLIKQNAALLVSLGGLSGPGLETATKASLDLAQALQIDVGTAFGLVAKASAGNTESLARYGLRIDENIPKTEKFAVVLGLIKTRFDGLAETRLNTFTGSVDNFTNSLSEVQEAFGGFIVNSPALRAVINTISESLFNFSGRIAEFGSSSGAIFGQALVSAITFGQGVTAFVIAPIEKFIGIVLLGAQTIVTAIQGFIALIAQVPALVTSSLLVPLLGAFGLIADKIIGLFNKDLAGKIKENIAGFGQIIASGASLVADSTAEVFDDSFAALSASAEKALNTDTSESVFNFLEKMRLAAESASATTTGFKDNIASLPGAVSAPLLTVSGLFDGFTGGFSAALADFSKDAVKNFQDVGRAAFKTLGTGVGQAFAAFGQALASGEDAGKAFLQSLVGVFADIAIQLGTSYILQGIAASANPLTPGIGGPLIAAGIGLATFGGLLKGFAGGKSTASASGASSGGGIAASPSPSTEFVPEQNIERTAPGTQVQVVIQGDILDSDDSGSRIVNLINQAFDKKGVSIQQGAFA